MSFRLARLVAIPLILVGPLALSHIPLIDRGIHFKSGRPDFGLPPHRYSDYWHNSMQDYGAWRPGTSYLGEGESEPWDAQEKAVLARDKRELAAYRNARKQEIAKDYPAALSSYRSMLRHGQGDVASIRRRIETLKAAQAKDIDGLADLLSATAIVHKQPLPALPTTYDPRLRIFVAYAGADRLADDEKFSLAGHNLYESALQDLKGSWVEESLIMAARHNLQEDSKPSRDDQHVADASLRLLLATFPQSRFRSNAYAWLGRIDYLNDRPVEAIRHYRQWARLAKTPRERAKSSESIAATFAHAGRKEDSAAWMLRRYTQITERNKQAAMADFRRVVDTFRGETSRRFWKLLVKDQVLLGGYLDYRLDFTDATPDLLRLGSPNLRAKDRAGLSPHVQARLAEAALRLRKLGQAKTFALGALARSPEAKDADLASFVLGTLAMRSGRMPEARTAYQRIVNRRPASYLAGGAKENLAIIAERTGDLAEALNLYDDMGYKQDVAYLADARMSLRQLASYTHRPDARNRKVLIYTLGMRYLRLGDWDSAEQTFARLTTHERRALTAPKMEWGYDEMKDQGGLQDPKSTLVALRRLDRSVRRARGSEAKAQAMLTLANYYYDHHYLLLYSAPLWLGERTDSIAFSWNGDVATKADDRALARHHDEHECFAHALHICQDIVRKYPHTKAAYHAAYRGGCAAEHLANMAPYWRWQDGNRDLMGQAVQLLRKASTSEEPKLAKKATKYAHEFASERSEAREAFNSDVPPARRWNPSY